MAARHNRTRRVERAAAAAYLTKAAEFFASMQDALREGRWNAAGLTAVHCAISANDALLAYYTQQRSASADHEVAAYLLNSLATIPDVKAKAETLRRILHEKHVIEYEDRVCTAQEAAQLAKLTERFYQWAQELIEP